MEAVRTALVVLRLRYLLRETTEQFAGEVVMAAFQSTQGGIQYLEPMQRGAFKLMGMAQPRANMPVVEARSHVNWALG